VSFKHGGSVERIESGPGVPFWPANEAEWELWHESRAAAVRMVQRQNLGDVAEHELLDMLGLLPEQLAAAEKKMRSSRETSSEVRAQPKLLGRKAPAQNRNH
jgi:hypothetical protein